MEYYVKDESVLIRFQGELGTLEINDCKEKVVALIEKEHPMLLVIDVEQVTFLDSSAIGFILARYNQLKKYGGRIMISGITPRIQKLLEISGIYQIILCVNAKPKEEVI